MLLWLLVLLLAHGVESFDLMRFAKTTLFFQNPMAKSKAPMSAVLYPQEGVVFGPLDDVIMGGASQSNWLETKDGAIWSGTVVEANGGFVGVRVRHIFLP